MRRLVARAQGQMSQGWAVEIFLVNGRLFRSPAALIAKYPFAVADARSRSSFRSNPQLAVTRGPARRDPLPLALLGVPDG